MGAINQETSHLSELIDSGQLLEVERGGFKTGLEAETVDAKESLGIAVAERVRLVDSNRPREEVFADITRLVDELIARPCR